MKWIRWWGLIVFFGLVILIAAAWYLLAPWLVKSSIESAGSEAVGAKVEVAELDLGLFPAKFNLKSLQVANADAPMTNLIEIGEISFAIDSGPLFWKKLVVEEMIISGVQLSTPRKTSGILEGGRKSQQVIDAVSNFALPDLDEVDTDKLLEQADLLTPGRIEKFNSNRTEIEDYWSKALDKKKFEEEIAGLKEEFNSLKKRAKNNKLNLLKDRKKWKSLKKKVKQQQTQFSDLKKKLKTDKAQLSNQLKLIKQGPADDMQRLMNRVGLGDGGMESLSDKFLGPKITPWVMKALEFAKNYQSTPDVEEENYQQGLGRRVFFRDEQFLPEVLIKNIVISGAQGSWTLGGKGNDIAIPPWQWNKPAVIAGDFTGDGNANFNIKSSWKSEKEMLTNVSASAKNWSLKNYIVKQDDTGTYELLSGIINSKLEGSITLKAVDLKLDLSLTSPKFSFPDNLEGWQKQMMDGVNQQKSIDVKVIVSGDLLSPEIKIKSGLEKVFKQVLKSRVSKETDKIKLKLENSLSEKIGDVSKFKNLDFSAFKDQLDLGDNQLKDLLGNF